MGTYIKHINTLMLWFVSLETVSVQYALEGCSQVG